MLMISQEKYDQLADEFNIYFYESGMSREYDHDYDNSEHDWISNQLGTSDWDIE